MPINNGPTYTTVVGMAIGFSCLFVFIMLTWTLLIIDLVAMKKKNNEDLEKVIKELKDINVDINDPEIKRNLAEHLKGEKTKLRLDDKLLEEASKLKLE
jgi:hypothetical protein